MLFVTRLLAEAAICKGLPVLTSETHGMAQRGGTVISHLKLGDFASPLIRAGSADGLLGLKADCLVQHGHFLKPGGWARVNGSPEPERASTFDTGWVDADALATETGNPRAVNLVLLGFALGAAAPGSGAGPFCSVKELSVVLERRLSEKPELFNTSLAALEAGAASGRQWRSRPRGRTNPNPPESDGGVR